MADKLNLNRFKASGIYTIEIDESQNLALPISTGRLVIGSSRTGLYNSISLIPDTRTLKAVYGDIDTKLEKNGSYFHRTIEVGLRQGPVYALNLLPVSDNDTAYFRTFNAEPASNNSKWSADTNVSSMSHFYNIQKLWYADSEAVNKWKNIELGDDYLNNPGAYGAADRDANKILTLVNLSRKNITAWIRTADVIGYNLTVQEYYALLGEGTEIPEFLNPDDFVQDYFVEIIIVEGDWTNSLKLSNDPIYKQYFNSTGLIDSKINDFVSLKEVNLIAKTQGSIIPDFRDLTGTVVAIDTVFNRLFPQTGVYCAIDHKKVDMIDLENDTFNSGSGTEPMEQQRIDLVGHGIDDLNVTQYSVDDGTSAIEPVGLIDVLSYKKPIDSTFYFNINDYEPLYKKGDTYITQDTVSVLIAIEDSKLYNAYLNGFIRNGDTLTYNTNDILYIASDGVIKEQGNIKYIVIKAFTDITQTNQVSIETITDGPDTKLWLTNYTTTINETYKKAFDLENSDYFLDGQYTWTKPAPNKLTFYITPELYGNPAKREISNANSGFVYDAKKRAEIDSFFKVGQYLKAEVTDGRDRVLKIASVYAQKELIPSFGPSSLPITVLKYTITTVIPNDVNNIGIYLDNHTIYAHKGIKNYINSVTGYRIPSMNLDDINLYPNGTAERENSILNFLWEGSNLGAALSDVETLDYRYIIDSFEGQIYPGSKQHLAQLAANHGKVLVIANSPSFAQYERSVTPSFIDPLTRLISAEAISTGGDLNSNPQYLFTFAGGEKNGIPLTSYIAYHMPNVVIYENGKNKSIPPAMYVANAYMKKYTTGNTFSIVAGKRGILEDPEIVGLEYDLTDDDRALLEPVGHNLIVRRRGFGVMIYSNNTGYQRVKSALNNIHVREALITIERDIERILMNFLFDWNDVTTRMRVKTMINNYLEAVKDARGISWFDVIFDDSNNQPEVLENNAGIVDIFVDFPRGIHKFINRITITRVGGQLSSEFSGFTPSF